MELPALTWPVQNGTFVLMSTGGLAQALWSACIYCAPGTVNFDPGFDQFCLTESSYTVYITFSELNVHLKENWGAATVLKHSMILRYKSPLRLLLLQLPPPPNQRTSDCGGGRSPTILRCLITYYLDFWLFGFSTLVVVGFRWPCQDKLHTIQIQW